MLNNSRFLGCIAWYKCLGPPSPLGRVSLICSLFLLYFCRLSLSPCSWDLGSFLFVLPSWSSSCYLLTLCPPPLELRVLSLAPCSMDPLSPSLSPGPLSFPNWPGPSLFQGALQCPQNQTSLVLKEVLLYDGDDAGCLAVVANRWRYRQQVQATCQEVWWGHGDTDLLRKKLENTESMNLFTIDNCPSAIDQLLASGWSVKPYIIQELTCCIVLLLTCKPFRVWNVSNHHTPYTETREEVIGLGVPKSNCMKLRPGHRTIHR